MVSFSLVIRDWTCIFVLGKFLEQWSNNLQFGPPTHFKGPEMALLEQKGLTLGEQMDSEHRPGLVSGQEVG